ncbi:rho guanine nucleotide exchange factor 39-like [Acanthaster planci]|uniref:Rho guanine nucleotide exchange factor 39-like n=1 Tax=Acanthaster planci TaxID=133434 RepID=A0A8B7XSH8_ACAPL|nr:rho guanine nucleotide exchange factor 39-like [Acanthaster planci]XP_022083813.1 rho guanine nucleotide exchange factor 39-like [Acanthaster planci]
MEENQPLARASYRSVSSRKKKLNRSISWRERLSKGKETFKGDLEHLFRDKLHVPGNHAAKMARKRERVTCEIFTTERKYQNHLSIIVEHFLSPLESLGLIPADDHRIIFDNIAAIQAVNRELLAHMEEQGIAEAFIQLAPFMKVYCTYANNFEKASQKLQDWEHKRAAFVQFLREQEAKPECASLTLHALLITPIQRIPRYKLLLEELLSCTPENHEEYEKLQEAAARMTEVTYGINEYIREHENFQKMLLIQNSLTGGAPRIIAPGRTFIREGTLMKVSKKGSTAHERMFFLFNDMLIYAKPNLLDPLASTRSYCCRGVIPLDQCEVQCVLGELKTSGSGALFKIVHGENSLLLYSTNHNIALSWIDALQGAIQQLQHKQRSSRKAHHAMSGSKTPRHSIPLGKRVRHIGQRTSMRLKNMRNYPEAEDGKHDKDSLHPLRMELRRCKRPQGPGNTPIRTGRPRRLQRGPLQVRSNKQEESHDASVSIVDVTGYPDSPDVTDCQYTSGQLPDTASFNQDAAQQAFCTIL